jgi:hypothetical protein
MTIEPPQVNEYQRVLVAARNNSPTEPPPPVRSFRDVFADLPPFHQTPITEWGACLYAKNGEIKAKSWSGLVTFYTRHMPLDWSWLKDLQRDWVCCPVCQNWYPKEPRYWWWRNREKGHMYFDACRDCKCTTAQRWGSRKRARLQKNH